MGFTRAYAWVFLGLSPGSSQGSALKVPKAQPWADMISLTLVIAFCTSVAKLEFTKRTSTNSQTHRYFE